MSTSVPSRRPLALPPVGRACAAGAEAGSSDTPEDKTRRWRPWSGSAGAAAASLAQRAGCSPRIAASGRVWLVLFTLAALLLLRAHPDALSGLGSSLDSASGSQHSPAPAPVTPVGGGAPPLGASPAPGDSERLPQPQPGAAKAPLGMSGSRPGLGVGARHAPRAPVRPNTARRPRKKKRQLSRRPPSAPPVRWRCPPPAPPSAPSCPPVP